MPVGGSLVAEEIIFYEPFDYTDSGTTSIGTLDSDWAVVSVAVTIETPFDDAAATVEAGIDSDADLFFTGGEVNVDLASTYINQEPYKTTGTTTLNITITPGTSTQGSGYLLTLAKKV